jgi:hypothetical protein
MFSLADRFTLSPKPDFCYLSAYVDRSSTVNPAWILKAHSESISTDDYPLGFGIECHNLSFDVTDWRKLAGRTFDIEPQRCGFKAFQWEDIVRLKLTFGPATGTTIQVQAEGRGRVESAPEFFGAEEVDFTINTQLEFTGVHTDVPLNVADPLAYSEACVRRVLPDYAYLSPKLIETKDADGRMLGASVPIFLLSLKSKIRSFRPGISAMFSI